MNSLRDLGWNDREMILEWRNQPEVADYMYTDHTILPDEHEKWFHRIMQDPTCRYWVIVCDGQDVGLVNLTNIDLKNRRCYWGFYIASGDTRGKGVGSFVEYSMLNYVFETLGLNKLCCEVFSMNEAVVRMHQGFGFKQEVFFYQHIFKQGKPFDIFCLAILKTEWDLRKDEVRQKLIARGIL